MKNCLHRFLPHNKMRRRTVICFPVRRCFVMDILLWAQGFPFAPDTPSVPSLLGFVQSFQRRFFAYCAASAMSAKSPCGRISVTSNGTLLPVK